MIATSEDRRNSHTVKANSALNLGRTDTDILDIAMTNAPKPKPQEVIIVGEKNGKSGLTPFTFRGGSQKTSPLRSKGSIRIENPNSEISNDAKARLDNQLQELQLRSLFAR